MGIPYLDFNPSRRAADRRVAIISGIVAGTIMIILSWMGTPEYAVKAAPAVEVVQALIPEEGAGMVREMGYAHLPVGKYVTDINLVPEDQRAGLQTEYPADPEFQKLLDQFKEEVESRSGKERDFNSAYGILELTQEQPRLRRIHWDIHYLTDAGDPGEFQRNFWIHEYSLYWEQYGKKDLSFMNDYDVVDGKMTRVK
jgi:hypothetical protein